MFTRYFRVNILHTCVLHSFTINDLPRQGDPSTLMHSRRRTDEPTPHVTLQVGVVQGPHMEQSLELHATVSSSVPRHPPKPAVPPNTYYSIIGVSFDKTFYVGCSRNCIFICQVALTRRQKKDFSIFESSCHLPTCLSHLVEASRCPFLFLNVK